MKKLFYSMLTIATMAFALSSCEDVPAPYDDPNAHHGQNIDENEILSEAFANNFGKFEVVTPKGIAWVINYSTATGTGYNSKDKTNTESESFLISPEIDLSEENEAYLTFLYIFRYKNNAGEDKVLITDQYTGDPTTTNWDDITGELTEGTDWETFSAFAQDIPEKFLGKNAVRIALYYSGTDKSSRTWEVKNLKVMRGKAPNVGPVTPDLPTDLTGAGTKENPYTVADANKIIASLGSATSEEVFVKGKVVKIDEVDTNFGNATYYMSDDGTENGQLYVYRGSYLGGDKFTANSRFNVGDDIIICGQLVKFHGDTPEVTQGNWIYSLNGTVKDKTDPTAVNGTPDGDGSVDTPFNVAGALTYIKTLGSATSDNKYVKGIVTSITEVSVQNGNATYYISDNGKTDNQLEVFRGYGLGGEKFQSEDDLMVGDKVIVLGALTLYNNTPEIMTGSQLYSINDETAGGGTEGNASSFKAADLGLSNGTAFDQVTYSGVTISTDGGGNTNTPKYYDSGSNLRIYPKNSITISSAKTIISITLTCTSGSVANGNVKASKGTANVSDPTISITGINDKSVTITNNNDGSTGAASQIRIVKFDITYAE